MTEADTVARVFQIELLCLTCDMAMQPVPIKAGIVYDRTKQDYQCPICGCAVSLSTEARPK